MAGSFTNNGDGTITVTFAYTADTEKIQAAVINAAAQVYVSYPVWDENEPPAAVPFEELTNQQKLDVWDQHLQWFTIKTARENLVTVAVQSAQTAAYADESIDL